MVNTVALTAAVTAVALAIIVAFPSHADHDSGFGGLTVAYIDLGSRGDSTLVLFPSGTSLLIDGGLASSHANVLDALDHFGTSVPDTVIVSHADADHVGGVNALLRSAEPGTWTGAVYTSPVDKDTKTYQEFLILADPEVLREGDVLELDPDTRVTVLSPPADSLIPDGSNASESNSNSVILLVTYGNHDFLFTADATYTTERYLTERHSLETVDVMNSPHHGSRYASTSEFIQAASPELVVFSANIGNQYGHPHPDTVGRYDSLGIPTVRTSGGTVIVQSDGTGCTLFILGAESGHPCWDGVEVAGSGNGLSGLQSLVENPCRGDREPAYRNGTMLCLFPGTFEVLVERGWNLYRL